MRWLVAGLLFLLACGRPVSDGGGTTGSASGSTTGSAGQGSATTSASEPGSTSQTTTEEATTVPEPGCEDVELPDGAGPVYYARSFTRAWGEQLYVSNAALWCTGSEPYECHESGSGFEMDIGFSQTELTEGIFELGELSFLIRYWAGDPESCSGSEGERYADEVNLELLTVTDGCVAGYFEFKPWMWDEGHTGDWNTGYFIGPRC